MKQNSDQQEISSVKISVRGSRRNRRKGFTLIELMLVVIIIGVLSSLVVPRLSGRADKARDAAAKAEIEANIPTALDLYDMDNGGYPARLNDLVSNPSGASNWDGPYLKKIPVDPWGNEYVYRSPGTHNKDYDISSNGKDGAQGTEDDIKNW